MRKFYKVLIVLLINAILITYTNIVFAVSKSDINNMQNEQKNLNNDITSTQDELENVQQEKKDTVSEVQSLTSQISDYEDQIENLDDEILGLQTKISEAQTKIEEDEKKYQEQQELLNERLVALYENGEVSYLDVLLSANNLIDFISGYYLVSEITKYDNELLDNIEADRKQIESEKQELETNKASLDSSKKTKEAKENALKIARQEKEQKVDKLSANEKELEKQLEEYRNYENSIKKKIKQMQEEYDRQMAAENNKKPSVNGGQTSSYGFRFPVANPYITARFHEAGSSWSSGYHTGVDFRASVGTPVYAVGDGQVFVTGYSKAYGNYVEIYHGKNVYSFYAHGSKRLVSEGDKVSKGSQIMLSGATRKC